MSNIHEYLKNHWGYDTFRPNQKEICTDTINNHDVIGIMPTGGGKSLCYMLPSLSRSGVTIVVTPLISLMQDQVRIATKHSIRAETINSTLTSLEKDQRISCLINGAYELLFLSPEFVASPRFQIALPKIDVAAWVIDEAHCVVQWGEDFRESYLIACEYIQIHRTLNPGTPVAAFTASATDRDIDRIKELLRMRNPNVYRSSFYRPNLEILVEPKKIDFMLDIYGRLMLHRDMSGIIYRTTRRQVEDTALFLIQNGYDSVAPYHAGMSADYRKRVLDDFVSGKTKLIVATIAFGLGIDKPDVRYVIHADMPKDISGYYQEIGRAGRDGKESVCILLSNLSDSAVLRKMANGKTPEHLEKSIEKIRVMLNYLLTDRCRWQYICDQFGEKIEPCGHCDNCLKK